MSGMRRVLMAASVALGATLTWGAPEAEAAPICGPVCVSGCAYAEYECANNGCRVLWCGGTSDTCFGPNEWAGCAPM